MLGGKHPHILHFDVYGYIVHLYIQNKTRTSLPQVPEPGLGIRIQEGKIEKLIKIVIL